MTPQSLQRTCDVACATVLPSGSPDTVGASDFGYFGAHYFGIPSLHVPLSNASSAGLPTTLTWLGVRMDSLLLSCMTLSFITSRRFIPTLSRRKRLSHLGSAVWIVFGAYGIWCFVNALARRRSPTASPIPVGLPDAKRPTREPRLGK